MAGFIQDNDYTLSTREEILDLLDGTEDKTKLALAERTAISQMKKKLAKRYDMDVMFAPTVDGQPDLRDPFIVMTVIDIMLYHLWTGVAAGKIPETRSARYNDALEWMKSDGKGEGGGGDMPEKAPEDYPADFRIVSRRPNNNKY